MTSDTDSEGTVQKEPVLVANAPGGGIAPSETKMATMTLWKKMA